MAVTPTKRDNMALADCLASDGVGALVFIRAALTGGKYQVQTVDPSDYSKMPAVGMIVQKPSPTATECWVQFRGQVIGVYSGLTPGEVLFAEDTGGISNEPPEPTVPKPRKFSQVIGVAFSDNIINLDPDLTLVRRKY